MRIIFTCGHSGSGSGTSAANDERPRRRGAVEAHDADRRLRRAIEEGDERQDRAEQDRDLEADRHRRDEGRGGDREVLAAEAPQLAPARRRRTATTRSAAARPAIAAIGISASSGALTAASSSSQSEANTAASGVRAPASRLGNDRFSEPHETYDENSPPTMFDSPWPRNSRLASMCWPERAATALAIEIDWPRATIVSAKAMPTRSGSRRRSNAGKRQVRPDRRDRPDDGDPLRAAGDAVDRERERGRGEQAEQHVRRARQPALQQPAMRRS